MMENIHQAARRMAKENEILRRELLRQTGCSYEDIEVLLAREIPVVNRRMGAALRLRFAAESFRDSVLQSGASDN